VKRSSLFVLLLTAVLHFGFSQIWSPPEVDITSGIMLPLGEHKNYYTPGFNVGIGVKLPFNRWPFLSVSPVISYSLNPLSEIDSALSLLSLGAAAEFTYQPAPVLSFSLIGDFGYSIGFFQGSTGNGPYLSGGGLVGFNLSHNFNLGLGASYRHHFSGTSTVYQGISVNLNGVLRFGSGSSRSQLDVLETELEPVFPVLYKYYEQNPLGYITLKNNEKSTIKNLSIQFFVKDFMAQPRTVYRASEVLRDAEIKVPIRTLFNSSILDLTSATKVTAEFQMTYTLNGEELESSHTESLRVFNRNNITWDDDRKVAAFVSATDPTVMKMAKGVESEIRKIGILALNGNFRTSIALFESLKLMGISYVVDPSSSYADKTGESTALDYLQFPRQTIEYKAGDCDDLTILYTSLLSALGIEAAFITVPEHIYAAVSLDMSPDDARRTFNNPGELVFHEGQTWLPVEVTALTESFSSAWQRGAAQWREFNEQGKAELYILSDIWGTLYEGVGPYNDALDTSYPDPDELRSAYTSELEHLLQREIYTRETELILRIKETGGNTRYVNSLGVLYAKYGLLDKASEQFRIIAEGNNYAPAVLNLGNIALLKGDRKSAVEWYEKALRIDPWNSRTLASLARISYEESNIQAAREYYNKLADLNPDLAGRYAYIVESNGDRRASEAGSRDNLIWDEE